MIPTRQLIASNQNIRSSLPLWIEQGSTEPFVTIQVTCESCNTRLKVRADKSGRRRKCPSCGLPIMVPSGESNPSLDKPPTETFDDSFDLSELLPSYEKSSEDFSNLPPVRKQVRKMPSGQPVASSESSANRNPATTARQPCGGCGKLLDPGVRYCVGCGHNNFDAAAESVSAQMKIQNRLEKLSASLSVARVLYIFAGMFRG